MTRTTIRLKAKLLRPAEREKADSWTFLILPKNASAKLPSRGMTAIEGTINGVPFQAVLEPDGQKSHWLKVDRKLSEAAGAEPDDILTLEIAPAEMFGKLCSPRAGFRCSARSSTGRERPRVLKTPRRWRAQRKLG